MHRHVGSHHCTGGRPIGAELAQAVNHQSTHPWLKTNPPAFTYSQQVLLLLLLSAYSVGWWLMAGAGLF
jgi:hypothetical protein